MDMPAASANPAESLQQISKEMQDKFDEAGMEKVEAFVDKIEDMMSQLKEGPGPHIQKMQGKFDEFLGGIEEGLKDPSKLGGGGAMAGCATFYMTSVTTQLASVTAEANSMKDGMAKLKGDLEKPMKELYDNLKGAMDTLDASLTGLSRLPKLIQKAVEGKDSPDDIAKIDTAPMKKAVSGGDLDGPLQAIVDSKALLKNAVDALNTGAVCIQEFIDNAPDKVKSAFDAPFPLCMLTQALMSEAPKLLTDLLGVLDSLQKVSLRAVIDAMTNSQEVVENMDVAAIKDPVAKFMESAKDLVDKFDKAVMGAKASTGKGMSMPSMPKLFG